MKGIKDLYKKLFFFIFFLGVLDFGIGSILEHFYFTERSLLNESNKLDYSLNQTSEDILIFGSSTAYHGYVPKIFEDSLNMSCYNMGQNLMNIFYHYAVLNSVLQRYTPKIILLDLTAWDFVKTGNDFDILSDLYPFYFSNKSVREVVDIPGWSEKFKILSKTYRYNGKLLFIMKHNIIPSNDFQKGYLPLRTELKEDITTFASDGFVYDSLKFSYLDKFIGKAIAAGCKVVVVAAPSYGIYTKNQFSELENFLDEINIEFLNFRNDTTFTNHSEYFYDITHVNSTGAELLTLKVAERLKSQL